MPITQFGTGPSVAPQNTWSPPRNVQLPFPTMLLSILLAAELCPWRGEGGLWHPQGRSCPCDSSSQTVHRWVCLCNVRYRTTTKAESMCTLTHCRTLVTGTLVATPAHICLCGELPNKHARLCSKETFGCKATSGFSLTAPVYFSGALC